MRLGSGVVGESVNVALMFHYIDPDASLAALTMKINVFKKWKTVGTRQDRWDPSDPCGSVGRVWRLQHQSYKKSMHSLL